jgi:hypothetical protein
MWTYQTPTGAARISYDSLTGHYHASFNDQCIGLGCFSPQEAAEMVSRQLYFSPDKVEIPTDLAKWTASLEDVWY